MRFKAAISTNLNLCTLNEKVMILYCADLRSLNQKIINGFSKVFTTKTKDGPRDLVKKCFLLNLKES
jgi:hypothetical protein